MRLKTLSILLLFAATANAQIYQSGSLKKEAYKTATVNTLFEDSEARYSKTKQKAYVPDELKEGFYKSQKLKLASQYIAKLEYEEAANLYKSILKSANGAFSTDLIQSIGDMYYYNLNMEKSAALYDKLHQQESKDMSSVNLYKYYLALEATGKYSKANRILGESKKRAKNEITAKFKLKPRTSYKKGVEAILAKKSNFKIKNLNINDEYSDFSPSFLTNNRLLYSSNNSPKGYQDFFVTQLNSELKSVGNTRRLSNIINSELHETAPAISPDGKTIYFTRGNLIHGFNTTSNKLKIYKCVELNGKWTIPVQVSFSSDHYSVGHPALSLDGKKLYFASDMPGSLGSSDIFVVSINEDGSFSKPKNLGPKINTQEDEQFPFVTDTKLYFSSNGHIGLGGLDIYETSLDPQHGLGEIKNLGQPINSDMDDFSFIIKEVSQKGFFSSNRPGGKGGDDIYSFEVSNLNH